MKRPLFVAGLLLLSCLLAGNLPFGNNQLPGDPYSRTGANGPAIKTTIGTTPECTSSTPGGAVCAYYQLGSTVRVKSAGDCSCFWTSRTITAVGAQTGETATQVTTAAGSGAGCGVAFSAGGSDDMLPWAAAISDGCASSWSGTFCTGTITGFGGSPVFPACVVDGDCTTLSAGTCTRPNSQSGAVRLECACSAASLITVELKR